MSLIRSAVDGSIRLGIVLQHDGVGVMAGLGSDGEEMARDLPVVADDDVVDGPSTFIQPRVVRDGSAQRRGTGYRPCSC